MDFHQANLNVRGHFWRAYDQFFKIKPKDEFWMRMRYSEFMGCLRSYAYLMKWEKGFEF